MPPRPGNPRKPHSNNRHEHGLVGPGKKISRQKSNGHLNGSPRGSTPETPPLSPAPNLEASPAQSFSENHNGSLASTRPETVGLRGREICQGHVPGSPENKSEVCHNGSIQKISDHRLHRSNTATSQKGSSSDVGLLKTGATILKSCSTADTFAILVLLLQLPTSVLTLVQSMFAALTLMPPTGLAIGSFVSPFDLFQGSSGPPSLAVMLTMDLLGLLIWYLFGPWAREFLLDLAQVQVAITLGGGNADKNGKAGFICVAIMLVLHLWRDPDVRRYAYQSALSVNVLSAENLARVQHFLSVELGTGASAPSSTLLRRGVAMHIAVQAGVAIFRRWVSKAQATSPSKPLKRTDMEASAGAAVAEATHIEHSGPPSSTAVDLPSPNHQSRERAVSAKKRRRQATQVRSRQPFWAALASTKVTVMREYEHSKVYSKAAGVASAESVLPNPLDEISVWITGVDSSAIKFGASGISGADTDEPFYVRINGAYWTSFTMRIDTDSALQNEHGAYWEGEISGLAPSCTYTCTFVRHNDSQDIGIVTVSTPAISDSDPGMVSYPSAFVTKAAPPSHATPGLHSPRRPSSPVTTLKNSIVTQDSKFQESRNRLARQRKSHKGVISKLEKEIESVGSRLRTSNDDTRQRQKHMQTQRSLEQAETYANAIDAAIQDLSVIPEEELESWTAGKSSHEEQESILTCAKEELEKTRLSQSQQLTSAKNELKAAAARRERMCAREDRLNEQHSRLVQSNAQGPGDKDRKPISVLPREEEYKRREQIILGQMNMIQLRIQALNTSTMQASNSIQALHQAQMLDSGPLTPEGPLPGTNPNPLRHHTNPFSAPFQSPASSSGFPNVPVTMSPDPPYAVPLAAYAPPISGSHRPRSTSNRSIGAQSRFSGDFDDADPIPPMLQEHDFMGNRKSSGSSRAESSDSPTTGTGILGSPIRGKSSPGHGGWV